MNLTYVVPKRLEHLFKEKDGNTVITRALENLNNADKLDALLNICLDIKEHELKAKTELVVREVVMPEEPKFNFEVDVDVNVGNTIIVEEDTEDEEDFSEEDFLALCIK